MSVESDVNTLDLGVSGEFEGIVDKIDKNLLPTTSNDCRENELKLGARMTVVQIDRGVHFGREHFNQG